MFAWQPTPALAVPRTWENTGTQFSTGGNWIGGTAPANNLTDDIGVFANPVVTNNPQFTADRSINGLLFNSGTAGWTFTGGGGGGGTRTLSIGSGGITNNSTSTQTFSATRLAISIGAGQTWAANSGAISVAGAVNLNAATLTLGGAAGGSAISGVVSGTGSLVKADSGTWTLSGANTYTGTTSIGTAGGASGGTLSLGANNTLSTNTVNVFAGTLDVNTRTVTNGAVNLGGGASGTTAQVTIGTGGVMNLGGNVTYNAANNPNGASISGAGTLALGADRTFTVGDSSAAAADLTVSTAISGANSIVKGGAGVMVLSGSNTYTGTTTVNAGVLNIQNTRALGATNSGTVVAAGAALEIQGGLAVTNEALTISGTGLGTNGALRSLSGTNTWTGPVTVASNAEVQTDAGQLTISGGITSTNQMLTVDGAGNTTLSGPVNLAAANVTKTGTGTLIISGSNSSSGNINILGGTLQVAANTNLGTGGVNIDGGTLKTTATMAITPNTRTVNIGTNGGTIEVDPNTTLTYEGFMSGTGKLTKTGTGTFSTGQLGGFNVAASIGGVATAGSGQPSYYNFDQLVVGTTNTTLLSVTNSFGPTNTMNITFVGDAGVRTGSVGGQWAAPWLSGGNGAGFGTNGTTQTNGIDTTPFLNSGSSTNASVTFVLSQAAQYFGILWGSVDASNSLTFLDATNGFLFTITGADVLASPNGDQGTNGTVYANINSTTPFSRIIATAPTASFEFDNVATSTNSGRSGPVDVLEGAFQVINNGFFNNVTGTDAVFVASGASLRFNGNTNLTRQTIGNLSGAGTVINEGSNALNLRINATSNSTFSGTITDTSNNLTLVKLGSGTQTLSGNNTYDGGTVISNGVLQIGAGGTNGTLGNGNVTNFGGLVINRAGSYTVTNIISGTGTLTKAGPGTVTLGGTGANTYTGNTIVSGGSLVLAKPAGVNALAGGSITVTNGAVLELGASNQIADGVALNLAGGTFRTGTSTTGFAETLGTLTLSANSIIDLGSWTGGAGSRDVRFANSSAITWGTGTLTITNWTQLTNSPGGAYGRIYFGTNSSALNAGQLAQIRFDLGGTLVGARLLPNGELVPIPEPRVYAAAIALLGAVGWRERRRLLGWLRRR